MIIDNRKLCFLFSHLQNKSILILTLAHFIDGEVKRKSRQNNNKDATKQRYFLSKTQLSV